MQYIRAAILLLILIHRALIIAENVRRLRNEPTRVDEDVGADGDRRA